MGWFAVALAVVFAQPAVAVSHTVAVGNPSDPTIRVRVVRKFETRVRVHCAAVAGSPSRAPVCQTIRAPVVLTVVYLDQALSPVRPTPGQA